MIVAVANILLLLVMTSADRPTHPSIRNVFTNEQLIHAVVTGDLGAADAIVKELLAEQFSQDLNKQAGQTAFNSASFWNTLVRPEWIDLSKNIVNLGSPLIALTIADQILSFADSLGQADSARSLAKTNMEQFSYGRQVLPSWEALSRAKDASSKEKAARALRKERETLSRQVTNSYVHSFKQMYQRWRSH